MAITRLCNPIQQRLVQLWCVRWSNSLLMGRVDVPGDSLTTWANLGGRCCRPQSLCVCQSSLSKCEWVKVLDLTVFPCSVFFLWRILITPCDSVVVFLFRATWKTSVLGSTLVLSRQNPGCESPAVSTHSQYWPHEGPDHTGLEVSSYMPISPLNGP